MSGRVGEEVGGGRGWEVGDGVGGERWGGRWEVGSEDRRRLLEIESIDRCRSN